MRAFISDMKNVESKIFQLQQLVEKEKKGTDALTGYMDTKLEALVNHVQSYFGSSWGVGAAIIILEILSFIGYAVWKNKKDKVRGSLI